MPRLRFIGASILAAALVLGLVGGPVAEARPGGGATAVSGPVFAWILLDVETGQVLGELNADALTYPASLTKMMTLYLTFEALNRGRVRLDQPFRFPPRRRAALAEQARPASGRDGAGARPDPRGRHPIGQ